MVKTKKHMDTKEILRKVIHNELELLTPTEQALYFNIKDKVRNTEQALELTIQNILDKGGSHGGMSPALVKIHKLKLEISEDFKRLPENKYGTAYKLDKGVIYFCPVYKDDTIDIVEVGTVDERAFAEEEEKEFAADMVSLFGKAALSAYPVSNFEYIDGFTPELQEPESFIEKVIASGSMDKDDITEELFEICDSVHASCSDECPVHRLNGGKPAGSHKPWEENRGCDCFKSGSAMYDFISNRIKTKENA
jgi:hypothetical protein